VPFCGDAGLAQLVVRLICNQEVGGSIPSAGTRLPSNFSALLKEDLQSGLGGNASGPDADPAGAKNAKTRCLHSAWAKCLLNP
jgi:hypothetical protein